MVGCGSQEESQQRIVISSLYLSHTQLQHDPGFGPKDAAVISLIIRTREVLQCRSITSGRAPQMQSYPLLALDRWERESMPSAV